MMRGREHYETLVNATERYHLIFFLSHRASARHVTQCFVTVSEAHCYCTVASCSVPVADKRRKTDRERERERERKKKRERARER